MCVKFSKWLHKIHICSVHIHFVRWQNVWQNVVVLAHFIKWAWWSGNVCHESRKNHYLSPFARFSFCAQCARPRFHLNNHINNNNNANEWLLLFFMLFLFSLCVCARVCVLFLFGTVLLFGRYVHFPSLTYFLSHISLAMRNRFNFCAMRYKIHAWILLVQFNNGVYKYIFNRIRRKGNSCALKCILPI